MLRKCALLVAGLGTALVMGGAPMFLTGGENILWIGNNLSSNAGPITDLLRAATIMGRPDIQDSFVFITRDRATMKTFATDTTLRVIPTIRQGGWKKVILQTWQDAYRQEPSLLLDTNECVAYAIQLIREIQAAGAEAVIFRPQMNRVFWNDTTKIYSSIADRIHRKIADSTGALILPCQYAWDTLAVRYPENGVALPILRYAIPMMTIRIQTV